MFDMKHRNQKVRTFTFKLRSCRRRVSPGNFPGTFLVERRTDTIDSLQYEMQPNLYSFNTFRFKRFFFRSSRNTALNTYYDIMKPFLFVMRVMGVLPVSATAEGKLRYGVTISTCLGKY